VVLKTVLYQVPHLCCLEWIWGLLAQYKVNHGSQRRTFELGAVVAAVAGASALQDCATAVVAVRL